MRGSILPAFNNQRLARGEYFMRIGILIKNNGTPKGIGIQKVINPPTKDTLAKATSKYFKPEPDI